VELPDGDGWPNAGPLALAEAERRRIARRVTYNPAVLNGVWAVAWIVGWGAAWLAHAPHPRIPGRLGVAVPAVFMLVAVVASIGYGIRVSAGISGPSRRSGTMYGWAWTLGFVCLTIVNTSLARQGLPPDLVTLLWAGTALLLVGVMHLAGGALFRNTVLYAIGVWTMLAAAVAVMVGVPGSFLVLSLAGGGGYAVLTAYTLIYRRRHD
jgi:hypothetical protein